MPDFFKYVAALIPSTGVGFLFYLVVRAMLEGDRRERLALAKWDAAHPKPPTGGHEPALPDGHGQAGRQDGDQSGPGADPGGADQDHETELLPLAVEAQRDDTAPES